MLESFPADRRLVAERESSDPAGTARRLVAVGRALTGLGLAAGDWRVGEPPGRPVELTEPAVAAYVTEVRRARERLEAVICALASGPLLIILSTDQTPAGQLDTLSFRLPAGLVDADRVAAVATAVCSAFGAFHGHIEDDRLMMLYQSDRAAQRAWAATPEHLRQYLPGPPPMPDDGVPALLVPQEYDRRRVPAGVWWVNYWDQRQAATVGEDRIRAAGWARAAPVDGGAWTLTATEEPLDALLPEHAARLGALVADLRLRDLQESHRYDRAAAGGPE
ncbi:MAG TPA: DUF5953 family protein [Pilimelia sp.]|nr:DUF5953 family protein [Pilimelia sp.]